MSKLGVFPRVLVAFFILVLTIPAYAADKKWLIHARIIDVQPDEDGSFAAIGGKPDIDSDTVLEVDFNYFITPKWSLELILATTEHDAK